MAKLSYWERRQAQNMYEYMQSAEEVSAEIEKLYRRASRYISTMLDDIFEKYKTKHNLTENEARQLLSMMHDKTSIAELIEKLREVSAKDENRKSILAQLESAAYQSRLERLQQLQNQIDYIMSNVYQQEKDFNTSHYVDLANESYYKGIYDIQQMAGAAFSFNYVDAKTIDRVINSKWSGKNYSQRIWNNTKALAQDIKGELLINLVTGRTNREVADIIANKYHVEALKARRLVRTESNYVATELNFKAYEDVGVEKYKYLATLDLRTSEICRNMDGKIFSVSERTIGVNCPPLHPWCRSTTICVISEELLEKLQRSARDPVTGELIKVPLSMTYEQWYDKYVKGNPKAQAEEQKIKNRASDLAQHKEYRKQFGDSVPEKIDDFQDMKYNNTDQWNVIHTKYLDAKLREKIRSDAIIKKIKDGSQGKHIIGHNNYIKGRSYLTVDMEEAQKLVDKYAGTGKIQRDGKNRWSNKEIVIADKVIGVSIEPATGKESPTKRFTIHYSKNGTHIVPSEEAK